MPKNAKEERLRWVLPIVKKEVKLKDAAKVCPFGKRTLERWVANYRKRGETCLEPKSTRPKTNPKETPIWQKERVLELRRTKKQCALKLKWELAEHGIFLHERTIGKFLKEEGLTRRYRVRKIQMKYVRIPLQPGELLEVDVKYVPSKIQGRWCFQYTAVDKATRWRLLEASEEQTNRSALWFLELLVAQAPFPVLAVKTDNHSTFTNRYTGYQKSRDPLTPRRHPFDEKCEELGIVHYLVDPGKPAQNGTVERSHRTDQEKFYEEVFFSSFEELRYKLKLWNLEYNDTKHCSLNGRTPNQMVQLLT